jgi:hypothetical protein
MFETFITTRTFPENWYCDPPQTLYHSQSSSRIDIPIQRLTLAQVRPQHVPVHDHPEGDYAPRQAAHNEFTTVPFFFLRIFRNNSFGHVSLLMR